MELLPIAIESKEAGYLFINVHNIVEVIDF